MNLANGANEFFHTQISHVRALPILKSATRGCEPAARGFIGWHGHLKVLASVNIETAFGQISFKQLSQLDRHANENPLPDYSALLAFASPVKQTKLVRHIFDFLDINLITDLCGKAAAVHTYL